MVEHCRSLAAVGFTASNSPDEHAVTVLHVVVRCDELSWNWLLVGMHAGHVRWAVIVAAYRVPIPQAGCAAHVVPRCDVEATNVSVSHEEHVRLAVRVSVLIFCPAPHVGCDLQDVILWLVASWYVLLEHPEHTKSAVVVAALLTNWPELHVEIGEHTRLLVFVAALLSNSDDVHAVFPEH